MADSSHLIRHVTLIDGLGGEPLLDWAVAVEGDRIAWLGPSAQAPAFAPEAVIDAGGRTLLPGMINSHVHLCNDGAADLFGQVMNDSIPIATIRSVLNARLTLLAGITTVRDCGGANFIKVMATGGVLTPGVDPSQTALTIEEMTAAVEEAHKAGKPAASHAIGNGGIKNALKAGIDSVEHGFYLDDEAINLALKQESFLVPTLIAVDQIVNHGTK